jgi:hypothetical protein
MKKLFLLLAVAGGFSATAQNTQSAAAPGHQPRPSMELRKLPAAQAPVGYTTPSTANKSTDAINGEWFCFSDAIFTQGTSVVTVWPIYPDSTVRIYGTNTFNWYLHGMGTSFDPKSSKFSNNFGNSIPFFPQPSFTVAPSNPYIIDSIGIFGFYDRPLDNGVDTLDIYVVATPSPGAFNITWTFNGDVTPYWGRADSQLQVAMAIYDWQTNSFKSDSVTNVVKITKLLDQAAANDTSFFQPWDNNNGAFLHKWNLPVGGTSGLSVPAGGNVVAYVAFRNFNTYPFNADIDTVNKWNQMTVAVGGANGIPNQIPGDFNCGLGAFSEDRYHFGNFWDLNNGSVVLAPLYNYTPVFMSDPWFAFHLKYPTASVKEVGSNVSNVNAYPNPATDVVNIAFTAEQKGVATIAITNSVGQLMSIQKLNVNGAAIASFPTSGIANGTYFYTVEINGQKTSASFVVNR